MFTPKLDIDAAQILALEAILFIAARPEIFMRFLSATGLDHEAVAASAQDAMTQAAVLDYLMRGEADLMAFCADARREPQDVFWALHALDPTAMPEIPQGLLTRKRPAAPRRQ